MADGCYYIYEHLVTSQGAAAVHLVDEGINPTPQTVLKHVTSDEKGLTVKKPRRNGPPSENAL